MGVLDRTWTLHESTIIGASSGHPDLTLVPVQPYSRAELCDLTDGLNQLSPVQRDVYRAARAYERQNLVPASAREISRQVGVSAVSVIRAFDALEEKGLGRRPPTGSGRRPFFTEPPVLVLEGATR